MKKRQAAIAVPAFLLFSFGLALFLQIFRQSSRFTILDHKLRFNLAFFLLWTAAFGLLLVAWTVTARWEARRFSIEKAEALWRGGLAFLPLGLFLLTPWLLRFYTTCGDLRTRLWLLALFILLAFLLLKFTERLRLSKTFTASIGAAVARFSALSPRRKLVTLFLISFLFYQMAVFILVAQGTSFSGDEPYYLLTSHSLLQDGDINLANNYAQKDYFAFYSKKDHPRLKLGIYGHFGRKGRDFIYPINLPGISVLMLPFYWLGRFFSGRWLTFILKTSLSPWAALLGLELYLYAKELWKKEKLALGLWALFSFSSPVFFYAVHLYPEVPIALFSLHIFRKMSGQAPLSTLQALWSGFLFSLFPWFGLKYNFFFWPLLGVSLYFLIKEHKAGMKVWAFLAFPIISTVLFYLFIHSLYGTFSPIAVYEGVMTPARAEAFREGVFGIPLRARIDAFLDYFLDQRDGLLLYSPLYVFTFLGLIELYRRRKRDFWCLLFIGLPFLLNYAFFTHRQGSSPQGRVLMPLSWIAAVALGYFLVHNRRKIFAFFFGLAAAVGFITVGLLLSHPSALYQPTTHEFTSRPGELFVFLSNLYVFLPTVLPSFLKLDNSRYWPNYVWLLAVVLFVLAYLVLRKEKRLARSIPVITIYGVLLACFFLWVLYPRTVLFPSKTVRYTTQKALGFYLFPAGKGVIAKENGDFYLHLEKPYTFVFGSRTKLDKVKLIFGSDKGEYSLKISLFDLPVLEEKTTFEKKEFLLQPAAFYAFKSLYLYEVNLNITQHSSESMIVDPFLFQVVPD